MIAFLNEQSLAEHGNWGNALYLFWGAHVELAKAGATLFKDSHFYESPYFKQRFGQAIAGFKPEVRALLRQVAFGERYWKCWRQQRVSTEGDKYCCQAPELELSDLSLCEAAERKLRQPDSAVGMLSAEDSDFSGMQLLGVTKLVSQQQTQIRNSGCIDAVREWIAQQRGHYDPGSNMVPRDFQTILEKDPQRFKRTGRQQRVANKYRRIYVEVSTGRQFYVDEGHPGHSAHLEVFDSDGKHLGEADIATGKVDLSKADNTKKITL